MKRILFPIIAATVLLLSAPSRAEEKKPAKYEYAIVKWDGPDRLYYNLPNKFEMVHIQKNGVVIPKEAQQEEFCLAYASNQMAKDGWEPVNLNSRRVLFRRALSQ